MQKINVEELNKLSGSDILLIDVRTSAEYDSGHIPFAVNLPLQILDKDKVENLGNSAKVYLVCKSGARSRQACEKLIQSGVENVITVEGGTDSWKQAGFPLSGDGAQVMSIERQVRIAAGSLVLIGAVLGFLINTAFFGISAFVGAGLVFAGITDWCGMGLLIMRMPWNCKTSARCEK